MTMLQCVRCGSTEIEEEFLYHDRFYDQGQWFFVCQGCGWSWVLYEKDYRTRDKIEAGNYQISFAHLIWSRNIRNKAVKVNKNE